LPEAKSHQACKRSCSPVCHRPSASSCVRYPTASALSFPQAPGCGREHRHLCGSILAKWCSQCKGRRQGAWSGLRPSPSWSRERRRLLHGRRHQTSSHAASTRPRPKRWRATRRRSEICSWTFHQQRVQIANVPQDTSRGCWVQWAFHRGCSHTQSGTNLLLWRSFERQQWAPLGIESG